MKKAVAAVLMVLVLQAGSAGAITTSGEITADETWSGTVTVTGDVYISSGTLTIMPGTVVKFATTNDNIITGGASRIHLIVAGDGALRAVGTVSDRITFTSTSPLASAGAWGKIEMWQLNGTATAFSYCDFIYGTTALEFRNQEGETAVTEVMVDHCLFTKNKASCIYITSGATVTVRNCKFHDTGKGIFVHGGGTVPVSYSTFSTMSNAIINAGMEGYENQQMRLDHCTFYNIDMYIATAPKWWDGYAVFVATNGITPSLPFIMTNSILVQSTLANFKAGGWTVQEHHNCFSVGVLGYINWEDGTPDPSDIVGDLGSPVEPLFVDAGQDDLRLVVGSPSLDAAEDGSNIGVYQGPGVPAAAVHGPAPASAGPASGLPNPMTAGFIVPAGAVLHVFDLQGHPEGSYTGTVPVHVQAGVHAYQLESDGHRYHGTFMMTQ